MTIEEATDLLRLQSLWRDAYTIALRDGTWNATRCDDPATIRQVAVLGQLDRVSQALVSTSCAIW
jgi:hypothetical protein